MAGFKVRLENVRESIRRAGVEPKLVTVVGVTKKQPVAAVREAIEAGLKDLANNYVQEGEALLEALGNPSGICWHFIGHVQSRKAKSLLGYGWVQSLDRISVVRDLEARLAAQGSYLDGLVEVNVGEEATKSGIAAADLESFLADASSLTHVRVRGIMGMPPPLEPVEKRRPYFEKLRKLFDRFRGEYGLDTLSMGTSADYLVAVREGATMVRLGTTLFGERR